MRVAAARAEAEARRLRQAEFLRSIGVPDLSPEKITKGRGAGLN